MILAALFIGVFIGFWVGAVLVGVGAYSRAKKTGVAHLMFEKEPWPEDGYNFLRSEGAGGVK